MSKGRSDISNYAIRAFLTQVGHRYDEIRGFEPFKGTKRQMVEVLQLFNGACCYCGVKLDPERKTKDHLVPLNKNYCGLHAWGNVVPSCSKCNAVKHDQDWRTFLKKRAKPTDFTKRKKAINSFLAKYKYKPDLARLRPIADNLYAGVGAVAMALIDNRFAQASSVVESSLKIIKAPNNRAQRFS